MIRRSFMLGIVLICLVTFSSAQVTKIDYIGTFGIFGKVAMLKTKMTKKSKRYELVTDLEVHGIAKLILDNHEEQHISKGHIVNGLMVSDLYTIKQNRRSKRILKEYKFDHKLKKVSKRVREWKKGKLVKDKKETLKFYARNDLLTLYFNLNNAIKNKEKGKTYLFRSVGLEKQQGKAYITIPNTAQLPKYQEDLGNSALRYAKILIHQHNFRKKKGDILLSVAKDGFIEKSVIKDVLLYGDAKIERVR
ncbi:MAG: hypothetical protein DRG09_05820 [Epsilonproteobacteria bacterium]|nr:MAG: hypothetical protein DRG09_05820 [Campylobacterota bacterium]